METRQSEQDYLQVDQCKKGYLYKIMARNFQIGIFDGETGFIGIRYKFGDRFLDTEYHWDTDPRYGTCKPIKEVCETPFVNTLPSEDGIFEYLDKFVFPECEGCAKCCQLIHPYLDVELFSGDKIPEEFVEIRNDKRWMKRQPNGDCICLKEKKCSIYDIRPIECRDFDPTHPICEQIKRL